MASPLGAALDYAGVAFLAASGAFAAAERRQDIVTMLFFGALTGIGGGTLRDLLIGAPVFWVRQPGYVVACVLAAGLAWGLAGRFAHARALLWLDAVGLSAYAVVGAGKAWAFGLSPPVCVVMGVITACFGGVLRDVLAEQPSVLLRREIYVTAAIAAATVDLALLAAGAATGLAAGAGLAVGFGARAGALLWKWRLPQHPGVAG